MVTAKMSDETIDVIWRGLLAISAVMVFTMLPLEAIAGDRGQGTALDNVLCNIVSFFTGAVGKGIATLAIIIIGIGALLGKISWGVAMIVAIGVGLVFGAGTMIDAIGGSGAAGGIGGTEDCDTGDYNIEGVN